MGSIAPTERDVIGGVDTHQDLHMAAVIDTDGTVVGVRSFSTTRAGYRAEEGREWTRTSGRSAGRALDDLLAVRGGKHLHAAQLL